MITINMDARTAAAVRQTLFDEQKKYTYDPKCVPPRISNIRTVITDLDNLIEKELDPEVEDETPNTCRLRKSR